MQAQGDDHADRRNTSQEIYRLWDELADYGPQDVDSALRHCMHRLCDMINADDANWCGLVNLSDQLCPPEEDWADTRHDLETRERSIRDPMAGWRVGVTVTLDEQDPASPRLSEKVRQTLEDRTGEPGRAIASMSGHFRAHTLLGGLVDLSQFRQTEHYEVFYRKRNISDRLWVIFPVTDNSESCFIFDRIDPKIPFNVNQIRTAKQCLRGIKWFHRHALLSHGLGICTSPLTPKERDILSQLLTGDTEKEIARKFDITPGSAHQYCVSIYHKFGVRGRLGLMALWLS